MMESQRMCDIRPGRGGSMAVSPRRFGRVRAVTPFIGLVCWSGLVLSCFGGLMVYSAGPGPEVRSPLTWPADSTLARHPGRPTLVVFFHPKCPCSQATVGELSRLLVKIPDAFDVNLVFVKPSGTGPDWHQDRLWEASAALPTVHMVVDRLGREARRFNAATSGHVALYDGRGRLVFSGGITPARNHWGDNAGSDSILAFVRSGRAGATNVRVFGCPLFDDDQRKAEERCSRCSAR